MASFITWIVPLNYVSVAAVDWRVDCVRSSATLSLYRKSWLVPVTVFNSRHGLNYHLPEEPNSKV
jgi:hypothetical protein